PGPQDRPGGRAGGFAMGGFARWSLDRYRLETTLLGSNGGGFGRVAGDLAAGYEGNLGGTSYQFRLGAAWGGAPMRFSVSPGWRSDLSADSDSSRADLNLSLTVSHPITSSLSVTGVAAARHTLGEANAGRGFEDNQLLLGAGVGVQF
ncbi:MAG: hypothetical protein K2Q10_05895, partial [Rhodospirillales bacterium]|nr:hypothetical protein [Rhodospirillales bacterium]